LAPGQTYKGTHYLAKVCAVPAAPKAQ